MKYKKSRLVWFGLVWLAGARLAAKVAGEEVENNSYGAGAAMVGFAVATYQTRLCLFRKY